MKLKTKNHIQYFGYIYIVFSIITVLLWSTVFNRLDAIKPSERIQFFVAGNVDYEKFENELLQVFNEYYEYDIREVTVSFQPLSERLFFGIFETMLINGTDFIIVPETMLNQGFAETYFIPIHETYLTFLSEEKIYREFGKAYGFLVYEPGIDSILNEYLQSDRTVRYYAFIAPNSTHLSTYTSQGQPLNNQGLITLKWMLGINP